MRKTICITLLLFALVLLLSSCGQEGGVKSALDPQNPVTITLWHYYTGENKLALEDAVDQFNQSVGIEKGVVVSLVPMGSIAELEEAVTNSAMGVMNAAPMPDIFSAYPDKAYEIDKLGKLCDLNAYFTQEEKDLYVPGFLADGLFSEGKFLIVPIVKSTELLYVNETAWSDFSAATGIRSHSLTTWEGVYDAARAYYQWTDAKTPGTPWDGKSFLGFDSVANFAIIGSRQLGVEVCSGAEGIADLNQAALRPVFDAYYGGMAMGYYNAVGKFRSDDIKSGELVAYVGSSSGAAYFPSWIEKDNAKVPITLLALPFPTFQNGEAYAIQQGAGMSVSASTPEKQEGSAVFLKWFTQMEQNMAFAMTTGYLPVEAATFESPAFSEALGQLSQGELAKKNVASVYQIALDQILDGGIYAVTPFDGSYDIRTVLQSTLMDAAAAGAQQAAGLKAQGLTEEAVLVALDLDSAFSAWITAVKEALVSRGINLQES